MVRQTLACTMSPRDTVSDHIILQLQHDYLPYFKVSSKCRSNIHPGREVIVGETNYFAAL
jgi:hypothetical protein